MIKNRIILIFVIIASGVFASFYGGYVSRGIFYVSLMLPVISFIYMLYVHFRCRVYQLIDHKTIVKEEQVPYRFILANEDIIAYTNVFVSFRSDFSKVDNIQMDKNYSLVPGERIVQNTSICCHYRGDYVVGAEYVYITDYLNLFCIQFEAPSPITVHVLPRVLHLESLRIGVELEGKSRLTPYSSSERVMDVEVRNYVPGDERKMIHWKSVARQNKLMTRKYTEDPKMEIVLFIDFTRKDCEDLERMIIEDKIIEATLAICDYYYRNDIIVRCLYDMKGIKSTSIMSKSDFDQLFELCTNIYFKAEHKISHILAASNHIADGQNCNIIITHEMTDELITTTYEKLKLNDEVTILYIGSEDISEQVSKLDNRIVFRQISLWQEITEVL